jgi:hypothetical protein
MGTSKGLNKYWKVEDLSKQFEKYKKNLIDNPRIKIEYVGKEGIRTETPLKVPLTMAGFEVHCYNEGLTIQDYFNNRDKRYTDYVAVCTHIRKEIRQDQIEGGMVGQYNSSITQRLNGLTDKKEIKQVEPKEIVITLHNAKDNKVD